MADPKYTSVHSGGQLDSAIGKALHLDNFAYSEDKTIGGKSYHIIWKVKPTASNTVYGVTLDPSTGEFAKVKSVNGVVSIVGVADVTDVPTKLSQLAERGANHLTWNDADNKGIAAGVSPIGAAMSSDHRANRLAFMNADLISVQYSTNAGSSWSTYSCTPENRMAFVTSGYQIYIGRASGSDQLTLDGRTRITFTFQDGTGPARSVYTHATKMLLNVSTAGGLQVDVEYRSGTNYVNNVDTWTKYGTYTLAAEGGWNDIPFVLTVGGGKTQTTNPAWQVRLTFKPTSLNQSYLTTCSVSSMRLYGDTSWDTPSTLARNDHLYSYDLSKNATFPAGVAATSFTENGTALSNKYTTQAELNGTTYAQSGGKITLPWVLQSIIYDVDNVTRPTSNANYVVYHVTVPGINSLQEGFALRVHKSKAADWANDSTGAVKLLQINNLTPIALFWRYNSFAAWTNFDNVYMTLTYTATARPTTSDYYGYTSSAGFILDYTYDSGNDQSNLFDFGAYRVGAAALTNNSFVGYDADGNRIPIINGNGSLGAIPFVYGRGVYYWDGGAKTANTEYAAWNGGAYIRRQTCPITFDFQNTHNLTSADYGTKMYLKCSMSGITMTPVAVTTTLPSSDDGYYYMYIAKPYVKYSGSTSNKDWTLDTCHPIYVYKEGAVRQWADTTLENAGYTIASEQEVRDIISAILNQ